MNKTINSNHRHHHDDDDETLSVKEFERLYGMSDDDYANHAPAWLAKLTSPPSPTKDATTKKLQQDDDDGTTDKDVSELMKELQRTTSECERLERVLSVNQVPIPADIPYEEAKAKVQALSEKLSGLDVQRDRDEYNRICGQLETYTAAVMASDEFAAEVQKQEDEWERRVQADNALALEQLRRHIPVDVRSMSEDALVEQYNLPKPLARKIKRTNILQLIRVRPAVLERMHPSMLEGMRTTGLCLTERRGLYEHMKSLGTAWANKKDPMTERKLAWFQMLRAKLKEQVAAWDEHVERYGQPHPRHKCNMIGNQCPFKANVAVVDYSAADYGCQIEGHDIYEDDDEPAATVQVPSSPRKAPPDSQPPSFLQELDQRGGDGPSGPYHSPRKKKPSLLLETKPSGPPKNLLTAIAEKAPQEAGSGAIGSGSNHRGSRKSNNGSGSMPVPPSTPKKSVLAAIQRRENVVTREQMPPTPSMTKNNLLDDIQNNKKNRLVINKAALQVPSLSLESPKKEKPKLLQMPPSLESPKKEKKAKEEQKKKKTKKKREKTPEERVAERNAILEKHYSNQTREIRTATRHCTMLECCMDEMDRALRQWVDYMILEQQEDESESCFGPTNDFDNNNNPIPSTQEQVQAFDEMVRDLEPVVVSLVERVKWHEHRSSVECRLAEDLHGTTVVVWSFIQRRAASFGRRMGRLKCTRVMQETAESLEWVHRKNLKQLDALRCEPYPTRSIPTVTKILEQKRKELRKKKQERRKKRRQQQQQEEYEEEESVMTASVIAEEEEVLEQATIAEEEEEEEPDQHQQPGAEEEVVMMNLNTDRSQLTWQLMHQVEKAQKMQRKLTKAILNAGLTLPDQTITYDEAKTRMAELSTQMADINHRDPNYFKLEREMEKYSAALVATPEYRQELEERERTWEREVSRDNQEALRAVRSHMPVNIRHLSQDELARQVSPDWSKRFKRAVPVMQWIRVSPEHLEKMHIANLEGVSLSGLTLTECRALYEHLKDTGRAWQSQKQERKHAWFASLKNKLKSMLQYNQHQQRERVDYRAEDYGYTTEAVYEEVHVTRENIPTLEERNMEIAEVALQERTAYWNART